MNQTPTWKQVLARNQAFAQQQEQRSIESQLMKLQQEQAANQPQKNWLQKLGDLGIGAVKSTVVPVYEALATTAAAGIEGVRNAMGKHEKALDTANRMSQANRDDWAKSAGFSSYQDAMANADKISDDQWQKLQNINEYANKELERQKSAYEGDWARQRIAKETQENFAANAGQTLLTAASIMAPMASGAALTRGGAALTRAAQQVGSKIPGVIAKPAMALGRAAFAPTTSQSIIGSATKGAIQSGLQGAASGALEGYRRGEDVGESALQAAGTAALTGAALGAAGAGVQRIQAGRQARQGAAQAIADTADDTVSKSFRQGSVRKGAKKVAEDAWVRDSFDNNLSGSTLERGRTQAFGDKGDTVFDFLRKNKVNSRNADQFAQVGLELNGLRDKVFDVADQQGIRYGLDDIANNIQERMAKSGIANKAAKQSLSDELELVLSSLKEAAGESGNVPLSSIRQASTKLDDIGFQIGNDKTNTLGKTNTNRISEALTGVADYLDDVLDDAASGVVRGKGLQNDTVRVLRANGLGDEAARVAKLNPTEFNLSSLKKEMAPFTFTSKNIMRDLARAKPRAGKQIFGVPGTEVLGGAMAKAGTKAQAKITGAIADIPANGLASTLIGAKPTQGYSSVPFLARALGAGTSVTQADDRQGAAANANINEQIAKLTSQLGTLQGGGAINAGMLGAPTMQQEPSFGGYSMSDYETAAMSALQAGDTKAYQHYASIYDMLAKQATSGQGDLSVAQMNRLADLQSSSSALDELEGLFSQAGGGQGIILGNVRNVLGGVGVDAAASTYNAMAQGLINQILKGIGKTDALNTEGEVQRALEMVPRITDNRQTALNKLASLRRILGTTQSSLASTYGIQ